jgi:hypothetical protein
LDRLGIFRRRRTEQLSQVRQFAKADGESGRCDSAKLLYIVLLEIAKLGMLTFAYRLAVTAMTQSPHVLEVRLKALGDELRAFDLIGLPSLQLRLQACDRKVKERIGQLLCVGVGASGLWHDRLRVDDCPIGIVAHLS